ncbi:TonB-dependent receptor [Sphingomonas sp. BIUV-7]|uniref:TonB-dependent receptor n=1 Tax=Sphingomonas natans TaxID=3063330 RepID=A0ABT8YA64_9SPHN|nr:TonB-dependent receptor [Sphingomonas sp. BIUV-7]MDO6415232.1 TonB-dependent receptor [Sphingomonas sp. BIUV-7]
MAQQRFRMSVSVLALALGAAGAPVFSQTTPPPAETPIAGDAPAAGPTQVTQAEDIIVTGSRLRGAAPVGSSVISLGRNDVVASGAVTTDRLIRQIPQVFDLGVSENSRGQSGGNGNITYGNSVNLRGIGPYATLILVDGHRAVNNSRAFDPSAIPTLGLERVEVVADGASAIYGSDAVAGVVNLIPRRTLDGGEMSARAGISDSGDFTEYQTGLALGKVWSTGQFMVAGEWVRRSNLSGDDRTFFRSNQTGSGGRDYRVNRCNPGTITANGINYAIPTAGVTQATAGSLVAGTTNLCDDVIGQDLFPKQEYISSNFTFTQEVNDWLTVFADGFYTRRKFSRLPASASATLTVPQTNAFFVRPAGFTGTSYTLGYNFLRDLPLNVNPGRARNWEVTPGVRIKLPQNWQLEGIFTYGRGNDQSNSYRGLNNAALNAALASNNPATAFDPYGLGRTSAATLAAISNFVSFSPTLNQFNGYEARLNGTLLSLPGGDVKLAAGYEGQKIQTDLGNGRGAVGTPVVFRRFHREVNSGYAELLVPIFGSGNAIPGFQRLEIDAAVRYDKYSDVGKTTNPKFGVNWSPVRGFTLRGSYGTSFRAPLITQIYGNSNNLFVQTYQNPAGAPIIGVALSGANLGLAPEEATTWSTGADWDVTSRLRLSATYFNVKYSNQVDTYLSDLAILSREAQFAGTNIILRGTAARDRVLELLAQGITLSSGAFPGGSPNNVTLFVDGRNQNLGVSYTEGLDFTANWRVPTQTAGTFTLNANATYLTRFEAAISPNGTLIDRKNTIFFPLKFKARGSVTWDYKDVRMQLTATHVGGYTNNAVTPVESVKSYTPIDFSVGWTIDGDGSKRFTGGKLVVGFEVRNLFDIDPPYVNIAPSGNGSGGYDATAANPVGRMLAVSVRKTW